MNVRELQRNEDLYIYRNSMQISQQTGLIGHLRGDFGHYGNEFWSTWWGFREDRKTEDFKSELDVVINTLRADGNALANLDSMKTFCKDKELRLNPYGDVRSYAEINDNVPFFEESDLSLQSFENYSDLDRLGRCGIAYALIGEELMPTEERGTIGMVKPSGWHTVKYDFVDGKYLYNRCHLIGYQLAGENANEKNLITGTRYFNTIGMLPFENDVADYVRETKKHVLYRVTPFYTGENLVADGVLMEAYSVEDKGAGVCYNVFIYNVQPGVKIDYKTGESKLDTTARK